MNRQPANINLHIERLVIDDPGLGRHCARELRTAVQAELVRQLQTRGTHRALQSSSHSKRIDGGAVTPRVAGGAVGYGQQIGRAIFRSIAP